MDIGLFWNISTYWIILTRWMGKILYINKQSSFQMVFNLISILCVVSITMSYSSNSHLTSPSILKSIKCWNWTDSIYKSQCLMGHFNLVTELLPIKGVVPLYKLTKSRPFLLFTFFQKERERKFEYSITYHGTTRVMSRVFQWGEFLLI